jgi:hypothetical protein
MANPQFHGSAKQTALTRRNALGARYIALGLDHPSDILTRIYSINFQDPETTIQTRIMDTMFHPRRHYKLPTLAQRPSQQ